MAVSCEEITNNSYEESDYWGLETTLDLQQCNPDLIRSEEAIKQYVVELCDLIAMKRFKDTTVVHFGECEKVAGYSMVQLIETSLISGHFANATNCAYINVFSCKYYNPEDVLKFTQDYFDAQKCNMSILCRK